MAKTGTGSRERGSSATCPAFSPRILAPALIAIGTVLAVGGCGSSSPTGPRTETLTPNSLQDTALQFRTNRAPVFAAGAECAAFTPRLYEIADVPQGIRATTMVPGHGCWAEGAQGNVVSVMTTATPFGKFWRRDYPDDDGSGITATMVDKDYAQSFDRFLIDGRYYAVRVGSRWVAGLDSGTTKTACMLVVDTGSPQPLLVNLTQQVSKSDPAVRTVPRQCTAAETVARTILDEHDPGGGSRVS
ncbi:hypothetical protein K7711_27395 [Nocardia sp. CA2R105]|uniref:hypothetical protein n=1 Tax=Nocardia coffeae TaxID=2873381 RepID=UPI001CA7895E|nr:hypothetical protein [Nocardia coffeae]MBY8860225.1 hypothetical protein [Nocardia coffeae]